MERSTATISWRSELRAWVALLSAALVLCDCNHSRLIDPHFLSNDEARHSLYTRFELHDVAGVRKAITMRVVWVHYPEVRGKVIEEEVFTNDGWKGHSVDAELRTIDLQTVDMVTIYEGATGSEIAVLVMGTLAVVITVALLSSAGKGGGGGGRGGCPLLYVDRGHGLELAGCALRRRDLPVHPARGPHTARRARRGARADARRQRGLRRDGLQRPP